jgi:hypothetical protein
MASEVGRPEYGNAHELASRVLGTFTVHPNWRYFPYKYEVVQIIGKLCRALFQPTNSDHYVDIKGYCDLILKDTEVP